jgi:septum formation inhibitor MinC
MDLATDELSKLATKRKSCRDKQKRHLLVLTNNDQPTQKKAKEAESQAKSQKQAKHHTTNLGAKHAAHKVAKQPNKHTVNNTVSSGDVN